MDNHYHWVIETPQYNQSQRIKQLVLDNFDKGGTKLIISFDHSGVPVAEPVARRTPSFFERLLDLMRGRIQ
jgi:adenine/guanine phosphoribosyltransferase-like PRPP-binding protein